MLCVGAALLFFLFFFFFFSLFLEDPHLVDFPLSSSTLCHRCYLELECAVSLRWGLGGLRHFRGALRPSRHGSRGPVWCAYGFGNPVPFEY